ncbi:MAG: hypothetical protein LAP38_08520 [Acidobacteriia bacterium]|nr:hypothetical protein [Terriglobia bacterium]
MTYAIAWSLIHSLWQDLAIAVALALVLRVFRPPSAQARYVAACLGLLLMLAAPVATFLRLRESAALSPSGLFPRAAIALPDADLSALPPDTLIDRLLPWITAAWLLGVVVLSMRWIVSWAWLQFRIRSSRSSAPPQLQAMLATLRTKLQVSRQVLVRPADRLASAHATAPG